MPATAAPAAFEDRDLLIAYAQARAAASFGANDKAAQEYAQALAAAPGNEMLAGRTLVHAVAAGDRELAVRAAKVLERSGRLAPDARFLLLAEAVRQKDWKGAERQVEGIEQEPIFRMLSPVVRAWLTFETQPRRALGILDAAASETSTQSYVAEHRALMLLALGKEKEGVAALNELTKAGGGRAQRLRIAGAAELVRRRDKEAALGLLTGDEMTIAAARALVVAGKPIPGAIDGAAAGIGEFLIRLAADIAAQRVPQVALNYARLATFLAPDNSETWLVTADLLGNADQTDAALQALDRIDADDPFASVVHDARVRVLMAGGNRDQAIARAEAQAHAATADALDWTRLGNLYSDAGRHADAADALGRALELAVSGDPPQPLWTLHLQRGGELEQAGRWPDAKRELETAYKLAPDQPVVLNYLGYTQLKRHENIEEAEKLVREASRLQPDNAAITDSLGWALFLQGRLNEAIELLERAAAGQVQDPEIHEHLGDAYYTAGRRVDARYAWQAALLGAEEPDALRIREKIEWGLKAKPATP